MTHPPPDDRPHVLAFVSAPEALVRRTLDSLGTCVLVLDEQGTIVSVSNLGFAAARFAVLTETPGMPAGDAEAVGRPLADIWPQPLHPLVSLACSRALRQDGVQSFEHTLHDLNRNPVYLSINAQAVRTPGSTCIHLTVTDLTLERLRERQMQAYDANLEEANTRLRLALQGSKVTVFEQDLDLRYTFMANPPAFLDDGAIGRRDPDLFGLEGGTGLEEIKRAVITGRSRWSGRFEVPGAAGQRIEYDLRIEPRLSPHGEVIGVIGTAIDLSDFKRYENALRLAMREITHRTKNLLAVIQATARRSATTSASKEEFVESFSRRLAAMSQSHDLLVRSNWSGADMATLVRIQGEQAAGSAEQGLAIDGPELTMTTEAAQHFSMAIHELLSNALKYGALSRPGGTVCVRWTEPDTTDGSVTFDWVETGGPTVEAPARRGFGTSYLQRAVAMALQATVDLRFEPAGLACRIRLPASCFQPPL